MVRIKRWKVIRMNPIERLPDSELAVMMVLWREQEELGTGKITELLEEEKGWSRSTTQVLLSRLEEKKVIQCYKQGRFKYYKVMVEEQDYRMKETKKFVEHFYKDSYKNLVASLVETKALSKEDISELFGLIQKS